MDSFGRRFYPKWLTVHLLLCFFPGNWTLDLGVAGVMLDHLTFRNLWAINVSSSSAVFRLSWLRASILCSSLLCCWCFTEALLSSGAWDRLWKSAQMKGGSAVSLLILFGLFSSLIISDSEIQYILWFSLFLVYHQWSNCPSNSNYSKLMTDGWWEEMLYAAKMMFFLSICVLCSSTDI